MSERAQAEFFVGVGTATWRHRLKRPVLAICNEVDSRFAVCDCLLADRVLPFAPTSGIGDNFIGQFLLRRHLDRFVTNGSDQ